MTITQQLRKLDKELREIQSSLIIASGLLRNLIDVHRGIISELEKQNSQETSTMTK